MAIVSGPTGPGTYVETDPRRLLGGGDIPVFVDNNVPGGKGFDFQALMNSLQGRCKASSRTSRRRYAIPGVGIAAPTAYGVGSLMQGELLRGGGEIGGGILGAKLSGGAAKAAETALGAMGARGKLAAPIVGGAIRIAGGLLGGGLGGGIASAVSGGVANAANAITGARREEGKSGLLGGGIGFSNDDIARIEQLSKITGRAQVDIAREMLPIQNQYLDNQMQRQMQLNQQTGQLTGALNRQAYTAQLAGGAQSQAGETVRTMMTAANPYAASAFQYRG
jgi:hypothetical protein